MIDESWYKRPSNTPDRTSAGGVVARLENGCIYVALTREIGLSDYVLPKGGLEAGEDLEMAARREIKEEAGLTDLMRVSELGMRERLSYDKKWWLKCHYFLFVTHQVEGTPTDRENHYGLEWCPIDALLPLFWPEQKELIETNRDKIVGLIKQHIG
jgi:8-oxo-dGTP pyrophosphatase MutT (NUDIX family)